MRIDDAEIYSLEFESDLPTEAGGTHIGMFLGWAIRRDLASAALAAFRPALERGAVTGRGVLFDQCDGKLDVSDLKADGAAFARDWYESHYLDAYREAFALDDPSAEGLAAVDDSPANQRVVDDLLDAEFARWQAASQRPSRAGGRAQAQPPSRVELHALALRSLAPVLEAGGFARSSSPGWSADAETAEFVRTGDGFAQVVTVRAFDDNAPEGRALGLDVALRVFLEVLGESVLNEARIDVPRGASAATPTACIALAVLAPGWAGSLVQRYPWPGLRIERIDDVERLLAVLRPRLQGFALPMLRRIESATALARAFDTVPLSRSPLFRNYLDYSVPLAFEQARHPRLHEVLGEIERNLPPVPDPFYDWSNGMKALITRIRAREANRVRG